MHDEKDHIERSQFPPVRGGSPEQPPEGQPPAGGPPPPPEPQPAGGQPPAPEPQPGAAPPPPPPAPAPGPPGGAVAPVGYPQGPIQTRDSVVEWLLCAFIPFYSLYWFHRANKEMQAWSGGRIDYNPGQSLTSLLIGWIIIVPPFVTMAHYQQRIREAQRMAGVEQRANFWGWFGRALLLSYAFKWNQDHFNEIAVRQAGA